MRAGFFLMLLDLEFATFLNLEFANRKPQANRHAVRDLKVYEYVYHFSCKILPHALFYGFFHRDWIRLQEAYLRSQLTT
jgi:hypothetical protein